MRNVHVPPPNPIGGYGEMPTGEILRRLPELDADELALLREHEKAGFARSTILRGIDALIVDATKGR